MKKQKQKFVSIILIYVFLFNPIGVSLAGQASLSFHAMQSAPCEMKHMSLPPQQGKSAMSAHTGHSAIAMSSDKQCQCDHDCQQDQCKHNCNTCAHAFFALITFNVSTYTDSPSQLNKITSDIHQQALPLEYFRPPRLLAL